MQLCTGTVQASSAGWPRRSGRRPMSESSPSSQTTADTSTKRWMLRAKETGTWLTTMPNRLNATEFSVDEFQDSLWLQLGLAPLGLSERCDGCGHCFSALGHPMTCKKGGLVLLCHGVAAEWHHLCAQALSPSAVSD
jgi:hypothetical protein